MNRESSRCRGNVREPPKHNGAGTPRKPEACMGAAAGEADRFTSARSYKIGFANLAGSGAGSSVSTFCMASTPPMGSLTMSETTTLETL
jgi:hypothetical protein